MVLKRKRIAKNREIRRGIKLVQSIYYYLFLVMINAFNLIQRMIKLGVAKEIHYIN